MSTFDHVEDLATATTSDTDTLTEDLDGEDDLLPAPQQTPHEDVDGPADMSAYTKSAGRALGLKPGRSLFKTIYQKLEGDLDKYHAASTDSERYAALLVLIARCDKFLGSTRKGGKKDFVEGARDAAIAEKDRLEASPDTSTFDAIADLSSPVVAFSGAVGALGKALGLTTTQLAGLGADELKNTFVEKIYIPMKMGAKKLDDVSHLQRLHRLMEKVDQTPHDALPDGDVRTVVEAIKQAGLGNFMINMSKAPKYMSGDADTDTSAPGVDGWNAANQVEVTGNEAFRETVSGLLEVIGKTKVGAQLLGAIGSKEPPDGWKEADGKKTVLAISPPSISSAQRVSSDAEIMFSNSASANKLALDPRNDVVGADAGKVANEPWRLRDGAVALFHEMLHVYLAGCGGEDFVADDNGAKLHIGSEGDLAELRIVGIGYKQPGDDGGHFPFDDPSYNPMTENEFRKQYATLKKADEYYLRPYYAKVEGQEKLSSDAITLK